MDTLTLEVVEGPDAGRRVELRLGGAIEIGRSVPSSGGLELRDAEVSRQHVRVQMPEPGRAILEDLGSRNGTLVNGREAHGPTRLSPGDQVQVGVSVLELRSAAQVLEQPSVVREIPASFRVPVSAPDYIDDRVLLSSRETPSLDALLDARVKQQARIAPLALLVLVALVVVIYFATR